MASITEFQSPSGSQWAIEPAIVPRLRTSGSAIQGAADPIVWLVDATRSEAATEAWRVRAPIARWPLTL